MTIFFDGKDRDAGRQNVISGRYWEKMTKKRGGDECVTQRLRMPLPPFKVLILLVFRIFVASFHKTAL